MLIWAPEIWPDTARDWYQKYTHHFWQETPWAAGFREFSRDIDVPWLQLNDPDAGPVIGGLGSAASAFAIPAAKAQGRYDHARPLAAQALVAAWPLPDGSLLGPRFLSNMTEAPYLGETTLLFIFARQSPVAIAGTTPPGRLPNGVYWGITLYVVAGFYQIGAGLYTLKRWRKKAITAAIPLPGLQVIFWSILIGSAVLLTVSRHLLFGLIPLLMAHLLPRYSPLKTRKVVKTY
jgi:hypothetical protein